jgi:membrane-associated phospholipid phosphatase
MLNARCFISFICLISLANSRADEIFKASRMASDFTSPVTNSIPRTVLLSGAGLTILLAITKKNVAEPFRDDLRKNSIATQLRPLGDFGGSGIANAAYAVGMLGDYFIGGSRKSLANATLMSEATFYSAALAYGLKKTTHEPRPDKPQEMDSFPSGSSTLAYSFASYVGARHSIWWGAAAYALATLTAISRLNQNRHYLHDVTAGATLGAAYGLGVYFQNFHNKNQKLGVNTDNSFEPEILAWIDSDGLKILATSHF